MRWPQSCVFSVQSASLLYQRQRGTCSSVCVISPLSLCTCSYRCCGSLDPWMCCPLSLCTLYSNPFFLSLLSIVGNLIIITMEEIKCIRDKNVCPKLVLCHFKMTFRFASYFKTIRKIAPLTHTTIAKI
jgi:hypothetical protein